MDDRTTPGLKVALTIAGSDSSGGAGIQADLKTFSVMGVYGASVVTAVTAQNTTGVKQIALIEPDVIDKQLAAVATDLEVHATKTGMLGCSTTIDAVVRSVDRHNLFPLVVDPAMSAKSGDPLLEEQAVGALKKLMSMATLVTANCREAGALLGNSGPIKDEHGASMAAREICQRFGARACIVQGIKRENGEEGEALDLFFDGQDVHEVASDWRPTSNTHGSGSCFSAAITAGLAQGHALNEAVATAKALVSEAIRQAPKLGHGQAPVNPLAYLKLRN